MTDTANQKSVPQDYPCMDCENAQIMDFPRGEGKIRTEIFCLKIHKLLDEGLPVSCSGFALRSTTE